MMACRACLPFKGSPKMRHYFRRTKSPDKSRASVTSIPIPVTEETVDRRRSAVGRQEASQSTSTKAATAKATLNVFTTTLEILGTAPVPGIASVTAALLRVIKGMQEMSQVETGWQQLAERLQRLSFLIHKIVELPETKNSVEELCKPLEEALYKLQGDVDEASRRGKLSAFFHSADALSSITSHGKTLDSIIGELTLAICMQTTQTKSTLKESFREEISRITEEISKSGSSNGITLRMSGNEISSVGGNFDSDNIAYGNTGILRELHGNTFGHVKGKMFSHNTSGQWRTEEDEFDLPTSH